MRPPPPRPRFPSPLALAPGRTAKWCSSLRSRTREERLWARSRLLAVPRERLRARADRGARHTDRRRALGRRGHANRRRDVPPPGTARPVRHPGQISHTHSLKAALRVYGSRVTQGFSPMTFPTDAAAFTASCRVAYLSNPHAVGSVRAARRRFNEVRRQALPLQGADHLARPGRIVEGRHLQERRQSRRRASRWVPLPMAVSWRAEEGAAPALVLRPASPAPPAGQRPSSPETPCGSRRASRIETRNGRSMSHAIAAEGGAARRFAGDQRAIGQRVGQQRHRVLAARHRLEGKQSAPRPLGAPSRRGPPRHRRSRARCCRRCHCR